MQTFYVAADVEGAEGVQIWKIRAEDEAQAVEQVEKGHGEFLEDHSEINVTALGKFYVIGEGQADTKRMQRIHAQTTPEYSLHIKKVGDNVTLLGDKGCTKEDMLGLSATSFCALAKSLNLDEDTMIALLAKAMVTVCAVNKPTVN